MYNVHVYDVIHNMYLESTRTRILYMIVCIMYSIQHWELRQRTLYLLDQASVLTITPFYPFSPPTCPGSPPIYVRCSEGES